MDVLETTQASRRLDSPVVDLEMLREKESEIARLNEEIASLRIRENSSDNARADDQKSKQEAVKQMIYSVKKNRQHRKANVQNLQALAAQLEGSISSGDQSQMQSLVESLKALVNIGEKANSKMDREMVNMIGFTSAFVTPSANSSDQNLNNLVAENQRLRRKLDKKQHCKKCGHKRSERKDDKSNTSTVADWN